MPPRFALARRVASKLTSIEEISPKRCFRDAPRCVLIKCSVVGLPRPLPYVAPGAPAPGAILRLFTKTGAIADFMLAAHVHGDEWLCVLEAEVCGSHKEVVLLFSVVGGQLATSWGSPHPSSQAPFALRLTQPPSPRPGGEMAGRGRGCLQAVPKHVRHQFSCWLSRGMGVRSRWTARGPALCLERCGSGGAHGSTAEASCD